MPNRQDTNESYTFDEFFLALNRLDDIEHTHLGTTWYPHDLGVYEREIDEQEQEGLFEVDGKSFVRWFASVTTDNPDAWPGTMDIYVFFKEGEDHAFIDTDITTLSVNYHWVDLVIDYRENYGVQKAVELYETVILNPDTSLEVKEQTLKQMGHVTPIYFYAVERISKNSLTNILQIEGTIPAIANNKPIFMQVIIQFSFTTGKLTIIPL